MALNIYDKTLNAETYPFLTAKHISLYIKCYLAGSSWAIIAQVF